MHFISDKLYPSRRIAITIVFLLFSIMICVSCPTPVSADSPHWLSVIPPILAIVSAFFLREVISSLLIGVFFGSLLLFPNSPIEAFSFIPTSLIPSSLKDPSHDSIILFSLMLGGMVGVMSKSGGMRGLLKILSRFASTRKRAAFITWLFGIIIFFDDYANTLLVGKTLQPLTDRYRISRAKLAYIVDSTAAPVASIAVISTWVGFEIGLIKDSLDNIPELTINSYGLFLQSIPYSGYSIVALFMVLFVAIRNWNIGPMKIYEDNTINKNNILNDNISIKNYSFVIAVAPIISIILLTIGGLYYTGGMIVGFSAPMYDILGASESFNVLLFASFSGLLLSMILSIFLGVMNLSEVSEGIISGIRSMIPAMVILILAWTLGDITKQIGTAEFVIGILEGHFNPSFLPVSLFFISGFIAFSTGTSWGAMAILIPIALPLTHSLSFASGLSSALQHSILLGSVGAVLSGATFGDHCSPISDTTILSSMASGCDHLAHVKSQIPYSAISGIISVFVFYIPCGFGMSPLIGIIALTTIFVFILHRTRNSWQ